MKKHSTPRTLLGISQEEMAMLLGVSRGHWSMFECGKRDLPLAATQQLAELLVYIQSPEAVTKRTASEDQLRKHLSGMLQENKYQSMLLAKKIAMTQKKHETDLRAVQLSDFLAARESHSAKSGSGQTYLLTDKSLKAKTDGFSMLVQYDIKQQLLQYEKSLIESKLRKLVSTLEK